MPDERSLLVVDYLRAGGTYASLLADHGVHAKPYNGKVTFVYDQLAARDADRLAQQCRGLVLREGSLDVVAYPFDRFFNHGQGAAAELDMASASFEEKLDGTLLIVYFDDVADRWMCATRSMCEAHGNINGAGITFAQLADIYARGLGIDGVITLHDLMGACVADRGMTYMFELTGPYNRVVCEYAELNLTLLGARRLLDFREVDPVIEGKRIGLNSAKTWRFDSIADLIVVMRDWSPAQYEGVIVRDSAFRRVKVKTPQYLAAAHATESLGASWRAVVEAVLTGHADDLVSLVPPLVRQRIEAVREPIADLIASSELDYAELRDIDDMKTFALAAQKRAWPALLFALKRGKTASVADFVAKANGETVLELCRARGWSEPDIVAPLPGTRDPRGRVADHDEFAPSAGRSFT